MKLITHLVLFISLIVSGLSATAQITVKGEKKLWHKVTVEIQGPKVSESATPSPFLEYKLTGVFTKGSQRYEVPGYFAADGNAANTGATSGNVWRIHFTPPQMGTWNYTIRFRKGTNVAVADNIAAGSAVTGLDNQTGSFTVANTDKTGRDLRSKGRLSYVNEHHLRFGNGEWFMKAGPDAPENLLSYQDFDNTPNNKNLRKTYSSHVKDWNNGDPTWGNGKGKGLIGAINYLSGKGMNTISFLTMNAPLGDDRNVFMWTSTSKKQNYDCSKLDQWEVIFTHAQNKGMHLHFKTQETENELVLDKGNLGNTRKLYYRELVARFAHHLALNWNICEEGGAPFSKTNQNQSQRKASISYIASIDPYANNVVLHTAPNLNNQKKIYKDLLGNKSDLTGVSLQNEWDHVFDCTKYWIEASKKTGKKWVVANDEQGSAKIGVPEDAYTGKPNKHDIRKQTLWGNMMAGGAGVEYYFGYERPHSDLNCQDFRTRDQSWTYAKHALNFFNLYVPFWGMTSDESKTNKGWCLYKDGVSYVVYLASGGNPTVKLKPGKKYNVKWYNPRTGGALVAGKTNISGGNVAIGSAPDGNDWVALIQATDYKHIPNGSSIVVPDPTPTPVEHRVTGVTLNKTSATINTGKTLYLTPTIYPSNATNKAVTWSSSNTAIASVNASGIVTGKSAGKATITVRTEDGNKTASVSITVKANEPIGGDTFKLSPIHDAYLQGAKGNNGTIIRVEKGRRVGHLQFDLSTVTGEITAASLSLTVNGDSGAGQIAIYKGSSANWTETSLNSANSPSQGVKLASFGATGTNHSVGKECTFFLNPSDITTGGKLNLIIVMEGTSNDLAFASKEHVTVSIRPVLTITTGSTKSGSISFDSIEEEKVTSVYPNPFIEYVKINNQDASITAINVFDITGQKIVERIVSEMEAEIQLEGAMFTAPGLYLLQLVRPTGIEIVKVIKQ